MPGLWRHKWRPIQFCLLVDNFGVEYVGIEHFNHLLDLLKKFHGVQCNMAGEKLVEIDIKWNYVIGHGIGRKVSQLKWRDLLKASRWSKQRWSVVTRSHSHSMSDGYEIQVRQRDVLYGIPYIGYPLPH